MDTVEQTPTEPSDYAALNVLYGSLLAGHRRQRPGSCPDPQRELGVLAAASFALSKLVVHEKVESGCDGRSCDEAERKPKGRRLRYAVGELLTCTRCVGAWSALGLVSAARTPRGRAGRDHRARRQRRQRLPAGGFKAISARTRPASSGPAKRRRPSLPFDVPRDFAPPPADVHAADRKNPVPATVEAARRRGYQDA